MNGAGESLASRIIGLISSDRYEQYEDACDLLLGHSDAIVDEALTVLQLTLQGRRYEGHARECSYLVQHVIQRLVSSEPLRRPLFISASAMQLRYGRSHNAVHWSRDAIRKLPPVEADAVVELMMRLSNTDDFSGALELLLPFKADCVIEYLHEQVYDDRKDVRREAVKILKRLVDPGTFDVLLPLLKDADDKVRLQVVEALFALDPERAAENTGPLALGPASQMTLLTIQLLGRSRSVDCLPILDEVLSASDDQGMRVFAARSIGLIRPTQPPSSILEALQDEDPDVRGMAAWALGEIANPTSMPNLLQLTKDRSTFTAWSAVEAIAKIMAARTEGDHPEP